MHWQKNYPGAGKEWKRQYISPSTKISPTREDGVLRLHHTSDSPVQKAVKEAMQKALNNKHGNCHTFRHGFATHLLENHYDIRTASRTSRTQRRADDADLDSRFEEQGNRQKPARYAVMRGG